MQRVLEHAQDVRPIVAAVRQLFRKQIGDIPQLFIRGAPVTPIHCGIRHSLTLLRTVAGWRSRIETKSARSWRRPVCRFNFSFLPIPAHSSRAVPNARSEE